MQATAERHAAAAHILPQVDSGNSASTRNPSNNLRSDAVSTTSTIATSVYNLHSPVGGQPRNSDSVNNESLPAHPPTPEDPFHAAWKADSLRIRNKYNFQHQERMRATFAAAEEEAVRRESVAAEPTKVLFNVKCDTSFGQNVYVVGATPHLGEWQPERAVPLSWTEGNIWVGVFKLPHGKHHLEYKYLVKCGSSVRWESGPNRKVWVSKGISTGSSDGVFRVTEVFRF